MFGFNFAVQQVSVTAALLGSLAVMATAAPAAAASYSYNVTFNPAAQTCQTSGGFRSCYNAQLLPQNTFGAAGDQFNVNVAIAGGHPLHVGGGKTQNWFFVDLYDAAWQSGGTQIDSATSTITPFGFSGPGYPLGAPGIPLNLSNNHYYSALVGFCCGYHEPNSGFFLTGGAASLHLNNSDPNPLVFILEGTFTAVPEPSSWTLLLVGVGGLGAALRTRRKPAAVSA